MTPEQALGNVAAFINLMIQRGGFKDAGEVHSMTEAHNVLAKLLPVSDKVNCEPVYISTSTNDKLEDKDNAKS